MSYQNHIIADNRTVKEALIKLDELAQDAVLFTTDSKGTLSGSLTDGDIRRALMKGVTIEDSVYKASFKTPNYIKPDDFDLKKLIEFRKNKIDIVPITDNDCRIIDLINFRLQKSFLPIDVVIMAGGKGTRLRPLTEKVPKPLLKVGGKSVLEYNLRRYEYYGVQTINITTNYLAEKIDSFISEVATTFKTTISTIREDTFLGTIGSVKLVKEIKQDYILVSNADLITDVDYESFFLDFVNNDAVMSVVSIPYNVEIPYAIMNIKENYLQSLHEKPCYTYFSNGGIYLLKKEFLRYIPSNRPFCATDLMEKVISLKGKIRTYTHNGYWLDIGKHQDYKQANEDIKTLEL